MYRKKMMSYAKLAKGNTPSHHAELSTEPRSQNSHVKGQVGRGSGAFGLRHVLGGLYAMPIPSVLLHRTNIPFVLADLVLSG